jgi:Na+/melibiose symporter-like transporter/DNA-binding transcriptional ArsR family regulator
MSLGSGPRLLSTVRNRDLRLLLGAGLVSQTGDWLLATGLGFQIYTLTGSTLASAAALFATQLPQVVFGSVAGVLVDRWDSRRVIVVANLLLSLILVPLFLVGDASQIWRVIAVVAASSCLSPFALAAQMRLLPSLVEAEELVTANAANAQVQNVARLVGAAAGGVLITTGELGWLAAVDIATFLLAAVLVGLVRSRRHQAGPRGRLQFGRDWVEGLGVIRGSRALVVIVVFFAVSGLGEATMGTLFAPFVADVVGGTGSAFGTIMAAQAVGGIAGGLLVTAVGHRFRPQTLFAWGAVAFGVGDLALFLYPLASEQVWPAIVIIAVVGLPGAALFAGMLTVFQTETPDHARGRVFGALTTVQNLAMLATTFAAGAAAQPLGIVPVISVQGAVYVLVGIGVLVALRHLPAATASGAEQPLSDPGVLLLDNPANFTMLPSMALASNVRTHTVQDPLAMRALAHPLRLQLHALVAREGSLTAADAARQLGISHALASHHLRQLAKYGFIEPAEAVDKKQHPWRVTATNLSIQPTEPEARASADVLDRYTVEKAARQLTDWQDRRDQEESAWAELAGVQDSILYLTPDELARVRAAWTEIIAPLAAARPIGHPGQRPHDTAPVNLTLVVVPVERTEHGG